METTMRISIEEFRNTLAAFTGTAAYYLHKLPNGISIKLTDGCQFVREFAAGGAYWLYDLILSYQMDLKTFEFQVWKLTKQENESWLIQCTNGNSKVLAEQMIPYSDFPIDSIEIWLIDGIALLPTEY